MSSRSLRRAAERLVAKQARRPGMQSVATAPGVVSDPSQAESAAQAHAAAEAESSRAFAAPAVSNLPAADAAPHGPSVPNSARVQANRLNALRSTGPRTVAGKAASSLNAVKTGLTGHTVLLPSEDAALYRAHLTAYRDEYQPVGLREGELVQSLADTQWRLARIPALEMGLYSLGKIENQNGIARGAEQQDARLVDLETYLRYERQLRNLHLQESRLVRRFTKEREELAQLQGKRREGTADGRSGETAAKEPALSPPPHQSPAARSTSHAAGSELDGGQPEARRAFAEDGFVFSTLPDPAFAVTLSDKETSPQPQRGRL